MSSRIKAFVAYLFFAVSGVIVLLISRDDPFASFHARQSIAITLVAAVGGGSLALLSYLIAMIPLAGAPLGAAAFALVIALVLALLYSWITGMINAFRSNFAAAPFVGGVATRWLRASL